MITYVELIERALAVHRLPQADKKMGRIKDVLTKLDEEVLIDKGALGAGVPEDEGGGGAEPPPNGRQGGDAAGAQDGS